MGIIMESKADAMKIFGVGGNVSVAMAAPAEPAVESESAAVDSQGEFPADVTDAVVSDSSGEVAAAPAPAEEVAGDVVPAAEEAPVEAAPAVEEPQPEPKSKRVVRGARNVRKKR